ncbi:MAG: tyrosine-type recombinase/integrase [Pirellulaceae bacterium]|nr:tyrosine-type recombinase/integrase [Pirellulaceae bacterium]
MASISTDSAGSRRIQFTNVEGVRKTIRLGKVSLRKTEEWVRHVEQLAEAVRFSQTAEHATQSWAEKLPDELYEKLVTVNLMPSRNTLISTLRPFIDAFIDGRKDVKASTKEVWKLAGNTLVTFFGAERKLASVTEVDAEMFKQNLVELQLAPSTIHKRLQVSRSMFSQAVKRKIVSTNPFAEVTHSAIIPENRKFYVNREVIEALMNHCDSTWKSIVALARFGGLRTPSETLSLRWRDIHWNEKTILVTSPKTEHHFNGATRLMPLFPELAAVLTQARAKDTNNDDFVVDRRYREAATSTGLWRNANLRTQLLRILKRAELKPWPRLFHNLRASRETELVARFPIHVVAHWLGNTPEIAMRHYLQVTQADYAKAATSESDGDTVIVPPVVDGKQSPDEIQVSLVQNDHNERRSMNEDNNPVVEGDAKSGALFAQKTAQQASAEESITSQELTEAVDREGDMQGLAIGCKTLQIPKADPAGLEPATYGLEIQRRPQKNKGMLIHGSAHGYNQNRPTRKTLRFPTLDCVG